MSDMVKLEAQLNSFDLYERLLALKSLVQSNILSDQCGLNINMHFHSFFSYNSHGWSPAKIAWESRKNGLYAAGLCDFDVLDGMDEFLKAGQILGLRTSVFVETRAFLKEFSQGDINSPGEPGVTYIMGAGFTKVINTDMAQSGTLNMLRRTAGERNLALIGRVNSALPRIAIDYKNDVQTLTPSGAATERHIISAYVNKAEQVLSDFHERVTFWAELMEIDPKETERLLEARPLLEEKVRSKLAKRGGIGYIQPSSDQFPTTDNFIDWVKDCQAIPMVAWLDGTSPGESDPDALLDCLAGKGAAALNIIPDRNWNYKDETVAKAKQDHLKKIVQAAEIRQMPINIGTEMNKLGLPFVDNLECSALRPYKDIFLKGARIMVGHSILTQFANFSYCSSDAENEFADIGKKNEFFEKVGALPPLTTKNIEQWEAIDIERIYSKIANSVTAGRWL